MQTKCPGRLDVRTARRVDLGMPAGEGYISDTDGWCPLLRQDWCQQQEAPKKEIDDEHQPRRPRRSGPRSPAGSARRGRQPHPRDGCPALAPRPASRRHLNRPGHTAHPGHTASSRTHRIIPEQPLVINNRLSSRNTARKDDLMGIDVLMGLELARQRQDELFDTRERLPLLRRRSPSRWRWRWPTRTAAAPREMSSPAGTLTACVRSGVEPAAWGSAR